MLVQYSLYNFVTKYDVSPKPMQNFLELDSSLTCYHSLLIAHHFAHVLTSPCEKHLKLS
jgi:hypothetical protein